MTFREAVLADVPALVAMLRQFIGSADYGHYLADNAAAAERLITRMVTSDTMRVFVVTLPTAVVGMLGVTLYAHPMSDEVMASEVFWWLDPAHRGNGVWLLRRAERWARSCGAVRMQMMHPVSKPRVGEIYEAVGYSRLEVSYQKDLI